MSKERAIPSQMIFTLVSAACPGTMAAVQDFQREVIGNPAPWDRPWGGKYRSGSSKMRNYGPDKYKKRKQKGSR